MQGTKIKMKMKIQSPGFPTPINLAHLIQLSVPTISFTAAYVGWEYIQAQKAYVAKVSLCRMG